MKLEVGKWYKARNGLKAFVFAIDPPDRCTKFAYVMYEDSVKMWLLMESGRAISSLEFDSPFDLIEELKDDLNEPAPKSPIQEKTVKELVPGVYGCVTVGAGYTGELRYSVSPFMTVDQLRAAANTFNEIADYLDEQK